MNAEQLRQIEQLTQLVKDLEASVDGGEGHFHMVIDQETGQADIYRAPSEGRQGIPPERAFLEHFMHLSAERYEAEGEGLGVYIRDVLIEAASSVATGYVGDKAKRGEIISGWVGEFELYLLKGFEGLDKRREGKI